MITFGFISYLSNDPPTSPLNVISTKSTASEKPGVSHNYRIRTKAQYSPVL